jgi:hypothetical protein
MQRATRNILQRVQPGVALSCSLKELHRDILPVFRDRRRNWEARGKHSAGRVHAGKHALIRFGHGLAPLRRQQFGRSIFQKWEREASGF